jgi:hypothetical protein
MDILVLGSYYVARQQVPVDAVDRETSGSILV